MLRADYKQKLGYFVAVENHSDGVHYFKIGIYGGNVLAAFVHRYLRKCDRKMDAMLYAFFADEQHMKNIEREHSPKHPFFDIKGAVHLNTAYPNQHKILAGFFARQGHTVMSYDKPPKERRHHVHVTATDR